MELDLAPDSGPRGPAVFVGLLGAALVLLQVVHISRGWSHLSASPFRLFAGALLPLLLALLLTYAARRLASSELPAGERWRVVAWTLAGLLVLGGSGLGGLIHVSLRGLSWAEIDPLFAVANTGTAGALVGHLVGRYEAGMRLYRREMGMFGRLIDMSGDAIFLIDPETAEILYADEVASGELGYGREELVGKSVVEIEERFPDLEAWREHVEGVRQRGVSVVEGEHLRSDGSSFPVEGSLSLVDLDGREFVVAVARDITERKRGEEKLQRANEKLQILNRVVRHDIRNDMQVMMGMIESTGERCGPERRKEIPLEEMMETAEDIMELTYTARDFVNLITEGKAELGSVDVREAVEREVSKVRKFYSSAEVEVETPEEVYVRADSMLPSVFRNLLHNAVQHNDEETPRVKVAVEGSEGAVEVSVADNGPGVPDELKDRLFDTGEEGLSTEGGGVGLYLVSSLVEGYGGEVWVEDNEPKGSVFVVELERAEPC